MAVQRLNLTRDQLASFLQDFEQIKQFERLFSTVDTISTVTLDEISVSAGNAMASATEALAIIEVVKSILEYLELAPAAATQEQIAALQDKIAELEIVPMAATQEQIAALQDKISELEQLPPPDNSGTITLGGTLAVANGGTGATSLTAGYLLLGNGTSAVSASVVYEDSTNIGIGIVPSTKLHVAGTIQSQSGATVAQMYTDGTAAIFASLGAYPSLFLTNNLERMQISSAGNVGIGTAANASALLDVQSTTKGVRMPNMTTTQKNAITSPAAGLMVFDTTLSKLCVYSGAAWQTVTSV